MDFINSLIDTRYLNRPNVLSSSSVDYSLIKKNKQHLAKMEKERENSGSVPRSWSAPTVNGFNPSGGCEPSDDVTERIGNLQALTIRRVESIDLNASKYSLRLIIIFWVTARTGLYALKLMNTSVSHTVQYCSTVFPFCLKHCVLLPAPPKCPVCSQMHYPAPDVAN